MRVSSHGGQMGHSAARWAVRVLPICLLLSFCLTTGGAVAQSTTATSPPTEGYPVDIDGKEILRIYEGVGSFTARDRAEAVSDRLQKLVKDTSVDVGNIEISDSP